MYKRQRQDGESIEYSTEFQKIEVAESEAEKNAAGKNKESEADKKNGNKGLLAGGLAALALLIIIGLILLIKKPWKSAAGFGGELRYRFRNLDTGIYSERETCMLLGKKGTLSRGTMRDTDSKTKKLLELNKVSLSAISDMDGSGGIKVSIRTDKIKNDLFEGKGELILSLIHI